MEFELVDADGTHHTGTTPQTLIGLPIGTAKITFNRSGALDQTEQLQVLSNRTASGTFTLAVPSPMPSAPAVAAARPAPTASAKPSAAPGERRKLFAGTWRPVGNFREDVTNADALVAKGAARHAPTQISPMANNQQFRVNDDETKLVELATGESLPVTVQGNVLTYPTKGTSSDGKGWSRGTVTLTWIKDDTVRYHLTVVMYGVIKGGRADQTGTYKRVK